METEHSQKAIAVPPCGLGYHSTDFVDVNSKNSSGRGFVSIFQAAKDYKNQGIPRFRRSGMPWLKKYNKDITRFLASC